MNNQRLQFNNLEDPSVDINKLIVSLRIKNCKLSFHNFEQIPIIDNVKYEHISFNKSVPDEVISNVVLQTINKGLKSVTFVEVYMNMYFPRSLSFKHGYLRSEVLDEMDYFPVVKGFQLVKVFSTLDIKTNSFFVCREKSKDFRRFNRIHIIDSMNSLIPGQKVLLYNCYIHDYDLSEKLLDSLSHGVTVIETDKTVTTIVWTPRVKFAEMIDIDIDINPKKINIIYKFNVKYLGELECFKTDDNSLPMMGYTGPTI